VTLRDMAEGAEGRVEIKDLVGAVIARLRG
jgi:hypothetical protein